MHPILLQLGPFTLNTYGALLALGAGLGLWLLSRLARNSGLDQDRALNLALFVLLGGLAGSRVAFVMLEPEVFATQPWRVLAIWEGGLVFYGGVAVSLPLGWWLARRWGLPLLPLMDCFAPALALGQAFGRLGCFSAGCCFGAPWPDGWCAVTFSDPHTLAPPGIPLHPAQLYSSAELFALCGLLLWMWPRRRFAGQIFFSYGLIHGIARVVIEQLRDDYRGALIIAGLTPTALFALGLAAFSLVMLIHLHGRSDPR